LKANSESGLTEEEIQYWENWLKEASQDDISRMHRFSAPGHPLFNNRYQDRLHLPLIKKWNGMTSKQSKKMGWFE
jgi:hypothetical protein